MSKQTFKEEDLIPLTVVLLFKVGFNYIVFTIKFVVENMYPEYVGMIKTDSIRQSNLGFLDNFDDEYNNLTDHTASEIERVFLSLANIYGLDFDTLIDDDRLNEMADDLYWATVIDKFPRDGDDDSDAERKASPANFNLYAMSMLNTINFLCHLLCKRTVDFEDSWTDGEYFYSYFLGEDYSDQEHSVALEMLQNLGAFLQETQMTILDITKEIRKKR